MTAAELAEAILLGHTCSACQYRAHVVEKETGRKALLCDLNTIRHDVEIAPGDTCEFFERFDSTRVELGWPR